MRRKLVFLDIDGTILDEVVSITDRTRYAVSQARRQGHVVCIATGRCMAEIWQEIRDVEFDGYVSAAGAYIVYGTEILQAEYMEGAMLTETTDMLRRAGCICILEGVEQLYISDEDQRELYRRAETDREAQDLIRMYRESMKPFGSLKEISQVNKITYFWPESPHQELKKKVEELGLTVTLFSMSWAAGECGEITKEGCHKGEGILSVARHLGIPAEDVVAIGDSENDAEMLRAAGLGIAMGNACEALKELASEVTGSVREDGVYQAFVKHGLSPAYQEDRSAVQS